MENNWYQNALFYQLHVKCFCDSNSDGFGDFKGLIQKLDYIQQLGCTAIWLQPFYPSPMLDDGYDIADYNDIHPEFGTLKDFKEFLKAAHKRGLKVVTELVINHTSDQHPWFQRARRAKRGSKWRNYYVWNDSDEKFKDARIIFKDFENSNWAWDPVANAYYWHRFYSHQPDLNYDSPDVHKEIFKIADFWFSMGVDGVRLDAIPYLYEREGTDCENLPETHQFLKKLRGYIDQKYEGKMLLAEANQWPNQAVDYFGDSDECHMAFHFPVMPRLFMAIRMEDRFPILDIMDQTPTPPPGCQWATFLRNHDELTLEMVTDEERDYMYRAYAKDPRARINLGIRRRLAPLLDNDRKKIELMNIILFSMPGSPIIYYGDEIGMGDNYYLGDRNGVRTPMQWNTDRNAGFSKANPQMLYMPLIIDPEYTHAFLNVENQESTINSLLWWMRSCIALRQKTDAFGLGSVKFLHPNNGKILAFIRGYNEEKILVVANLSRHSQYAEIPLEEYMGYTPKDLFSNNAFAKVSHPKYGLTLSGYGYFWLQLEQAEDHVPYVQEKVIDSSFCWDDKLITKTLISYLPKCRWFGDKAKKIADIKIKERFIVSHAVFVIVDVSFLEGSTSTYQIPLLFLSHEGQMRFKERYPQGIIARFSDGLLVDALYDADFQKDLFECFIKKKKLKGMKAELQFSVTKDVKRDSGFFSEILSVEQSNSSLQFLNRYFLKVFRRVEEGMNPDVELTEFLTRSSKFNATPSFLGKCELVVGKNKIALGLLQAYVPNAGLLWTNTLDNILRFFDLCLIDGENLEETMGWMFLETVALLGKRTAEMHKALSLGQSEPIKREPFTPFYQKSLYQTMRGQLKRVFQLLLANKNETLLAEEVLKKEEAILDVFKFLLHTPILADKIRIHGDYHLGQVLHTGKDIVIIDFEGEPQMPISERRLKKCALQDVASMVRSFHYALLTAINQREEVKEKLQPFLMPWYEKTKSTFLHAYLQEMSDMGLIPDSHEILKNLMHAFMLHKAVYEVGYELQNRPALVQIPLQGILMELGS